MISTCLPSLRGRGGGVGGRRPVLSYLGRRVIEAESGPFLERNLVVVVDGSVAPCAVLEPRLDAGCAQLTSLLERGKAARLLQLLLARLPLRFLTLK
jgi:hypothetical protein